MLKSDLPRFSRTKKEAQLDNKNMDNLLFDILYLNISKFFKGFLNLQLPTFTPLNSLIA